MPICLYTIYGCPWCIRIEQWHKHYSLLSYVPGLNLMCAHVCMHACLYVCLCVCVGFPYQQAILGHQQVIWGFNSVLTLSTWIYKMTTGKGSVPQECSSTLDTSHNPKLQVGGSNNSEGHLQVHIVTYTLNTWLSIRGSHDTLLGFYDLSEQLIELRKPVDSTLPTYYKGY